MSRWTSLRRFTQAVLASFIAAIAAPRAGLLVHHHVGGEHAHVHLDGDGGTEDHHQGGPQHHHDLPCPGETAVEAPDAVDAWHAHVQQPFQHVAPIALAHLAPIETLAALVAGASSVILSVPLLPTPARAPPLIAGS